MGRRDEVDGEGAQSLGVLRVFNNFTKGLRVGAFFI
jgi:hypothetical protein